MARDLHHIGVVIAATGDGADVWPAFKRQPHGGATGRAKVNEDLLLAACRHMRVLPKLAVIELNRIHRKNRFRVERRARHALAKRAVANECPRWRLIGGESNLAAKATALEEGRHGVWIFCCGSVEVGKDCDAQRLNQAAPRKGSARQSR